MSLIKMKLIGKTPAICSLEDGSATYCLNHTGDETPAFDEKLVSKAMKKGVLLGSLQMVQVEKPKEIKLEPKTEASKEENIDTKPETKKQSPKKPDQKN